MNSLNSIGKLMRRQPAAVLVIWSAVLFSTGCTSEEPIRMGFVAQLTGVQAELGIQERNGALLAVEEINTGGGIAGRPIELIVQDDLGTPEGAQSADRKLIDAGVVAIIGHATSEQTIAGLAVTNPAHIVMISPTATSPELSGQDDCFFRITTSLVNRAQALARHIIQDRHITRIAVIYDTDNIAYSQAFIEAFTGKYQTLGGKPIGKAEFSSKSQPDFTPLVVKLRESNPDGLLIIAIDSDTALIAQRTRLIGWQIPLFASAWAQTEVLINNGGKAVEGLEIEIANTFNDQTPAFLDFKTHYRDRFGKSPAFGAAFGYEAAQVLATALQKTGSQVDRLPSVLTGIKNFKGLTDTISFDRYGDVIRPFYLAVIHGGKYMDIKAIEHTEP